MRLFATSLALAALVSSFAFGDDAEVLPGGVVRLRVAPSFTTIDKDYDKDGKAEALDDTLGLNGINGALEYGITDAITLGLKWAPGYTYSTSHSDSDNEKALVTGPADLEIGGKIQVVGAKGFVPSEQFRLALTPGVSLPLDKYDLDAELENNIAGDDYRFTSPSAHLSFGFGLKADFDYIINETFYVNLHSEARSYLPYKGVTLATYAGTDDVTTTYGLEYNIELEPHAKFALGGDSSINIGLPLTYAAELADAYDVAGTESDQETPPTVTSIAPWVSYFTVLGPLPLEVQAQYSLPLAAVMTQPLKTFSIQVKLYYKF